MKKLPLTFGAAFQTAEPPQRARKEVNLIKLTNAETGTDPPKTFTDSKIAKSMVKTSDPFFL